MDNELCNQIHWINKTTVDLCESLEIWDKQLAIEQLEHIRHVCLWIISILDDPEYEDKWVLSFNKR